MNNQYLREQQSMPGTIREEDYIFIDVLDKDEIERITGFRIKADFYQELSFIEIFWGEKGVKEVVCDYIDTLLEDIELYTELVFSLSWKLYHHTKDNSKYIEIYDKLYRIAYKRGLAFYKGVEASYFISVLD